MRKVEREVYLQVLDNLWMQHLENMDHLREGIHWISVGQQDPLVEYRRRGQLLFEAMQIDLRHEVLRALFHAEPISKEDIDRVTETDLTRAARGSVENANQIVNNQAEFEEKDFNKPIDVPKKKQTQTIKKARKTERKRKTAAKRRRK
jgi:preprotein translocase subunit SecA